MKILDLFATLSLDGKAFFSGLKSASSSFSSFASSVSTGVSKLEGTVEASVKRIGVAFVGLGSTLAATGIKYNSMMENYTADFTTLLQDATKAQQKVEELRKLDLISPLDMNTLAGATKTMLSFGVAEDEVGSKLTELTDISMGNAERMNSLALAYAQIRSVGKLTMIDLRQMANQGFNPLKVIAEKTGVALGDLQDFMSYGKPSELMQESIKAANEEVERLGVNASEGAKMLAQMGEEGQISADIVSRAITIATSEGGQYFKAAENAAKTLTGQLSMLKGGVNKLIGSGFQPMSESLTEDILPYMNQLIEDLDTAFNRHGGGTEGLTGMLAVVRDELIKMRDESGEYTKEAEHSIVRGAFLAKNTLKVFNGVLPSFLETGGAIFQKIREGIDINLPELRTSAATISEYLIPDVITLKADLLTLGLEIIGGIADGINQDFSDEGEGRIASSIKNGISKIAEWVNNEDNKASISSAANSMLKTLADAIVEYAPEIFIGVGDIILRSIFGEKIGGGLSESLNLSTHALLVGVGAGDEKDKAAMGALVVGMLEEQVESGHKPNIGGGTFGTGLFSADSGIVAGLEAVRKGAKDAGDEINNANAALENLDGKHVTTYWNMIGPMGGITKGLQNTNSEQGNAHYVRGHATGLDYVPYDEYMARLHEGEAVLTKEEAKRWRRGEMDGGMMVVREEQNTRPIALYIDGQEVASVLYNQMNKRINNGNLQQIYGMGG